MRIAILIVGFSVAVGLPASAANGVFVGLLRYEIPALTTSIGKVVSASGLVWAALTSRSVIVMAIIVAGSNLFAYCFQFEMLRRVAPYMRFRWNLITRAALKELAGYCISLTAWSIGMLLINGFDLVMVGRFELSAVAPYSAAALLVLFLESIQNAVFGSLYRTRRACTLEKNQALSVSYYSGPHVLEYTCCFQEPCRLLCFRTGSSEFGWGLATRILVEGFLQCC